MNKNYDSTITISNNILKCVYNMIVLRTINVVKRKKSFLILVIPRITNYLFMFKILQTQSQPNENGGMLKFDNKKNILDLYYNKHIALDFNNKSITSL